MKQVSQNHSSGFQHKEKNMTIHRAAIIGSLLSLAALPHPSLGHAGTNACQENDIGVINGTFDCPNDPGDRAWKYGAQFNEQTNGFFAEITSAADRSTNVLKISNIFVDSTDVQPFLPREIVWQDDITVGDQPAHQLVLRFDHRVKQEIPFEDALIVEFTVNGITESDTNFTRLESLTVTSAATDDTSECNGWLTSEVYADIPGGITSTITTCRIAFRTKQLLIGDEGSSLFQCNNVRAIYPDIMLDNVEIRAITSECDVQPIDDGQPQACALTDCGGAGTTENYPPSLATAVLPVEGPDQQDDRDFRFRCPKSISCCGVGFTARTGATTTCTEYDRSPSEALTCSSIADLTFDDQVDGSDLTVLLGEWGLTGACLKADLNGDGQVDGADLAILLGEWGGCA